MSAAPHPDPDHAKGRPRNLGDLLHAAKALGAVQEREWRGLVEATARGDQLAMAALYQRAHRIVFTLVARITGDRTTAEEVTVDVFYDVWRRAAAYDPAAGPVIGWIMNQARSRAIDRLRFEQRQKRTAPTGGRPQPAGAEAPDDALHLEEKGQVLRAAVRELTSDERQAIETAFFGQLSYREVAERLQQPLGTIKTRIRSALTKLREALDARRESL